MTRVRVLAWKFWDMMRCQKLPNREHRSHHDDFPFAQARFTSLCTIGFHVIRQPAIAVRFTAAANKMHRPALKHLLADEIPSQIEAIYTQTGRRLNECFDFRVQPQNIRQVHHNYIFARLDRSHMHEYSTLFSRVTESRRATVSMHFRVTEWASVYCEAHLIATALLCLPPLRVVSLAKTPGTCTCFRTSTSKSPHLIGP